MKSRGTLSGTRPGLKWRFDGSFKLMMARRRCRLTLVVMVLLLLGACARPQGKPQPVLETPLVWPPPPAPPRVRFLQSFSRPEDLGISKGFWQRVGELLGGSSTARLIRPMAVVAAGDVLYVADPGANGVHRFDLVQKRYDLIRRKGGRPLPSPVGLALGAEGEVLVADSLLAQILRIAPGTREAVPLSLEAGLKQPTALALDPPHERLYVVDTGAHQVKVFARDGSLLFTFGRRGRGEGEFNYPVAIWQDRSEHLLITDALNFRIQIFDGEGDFWGTFGRLGDASGDFSRPKGVATDSFGHIYVVDSLFHAVQIFNRQGEFLLSFGSQGRGPGEFWLPTGIFIDRDDTIYVADSHNQRVQVFRYVGGKE
ncbi:MAG: 6-bladed beta-propeller [Nitrospinota bacterium]|nr:MAG: 6-bladed beta-propeller [Nitrospinota bacterium]